MINPNPWKHRNFLTSSGNHTAHQRFMSELFHAVPSAIVVCKCSEHTNKSDPASVGSARVDTAAKHSAKWNI